MPQEYRQKTSILYPRVQTLETEIQTTILSSGGIVRLNIPIETLYRILRDGISVSGGITIEAGTGSALGISQSRFASLDPEIEDISIAAVRMQTSANLEITGLLESGREIGVGLDSGALISFVFASDFQFTTDGRLRSLANPTQPEQMPIRRAIGFRIQNNAVGTATETVFVTWLFWITQRKDLV